MWAWPPCPIIMKKESCKKVPSSFEVVDSCHWIQHLLMPFITLKTVPWLCDLFHSFNMTPVKLNCLVWWAWIGIWVYFAFSWLRSWNFFMFKLFGFLCFKKIPIQRLEYLLFSWGNVYWCIKEFFMYSEYRPLGYVTGLLNEIVFSSLNIESNFFLIDSFKQYLLIVLTSGWIWHFPISLRCCKV